MLAHIVVTAYHIYLKIFSSNLRWTPSIPIYEGNMSNCICSQSVKADSCILLICDEIIALRSDGRTWWRTARWISAELLRNWARSDGLLRAQRGQQRTYTAYKQSQAQSTAFLLPCGRVVRSLSTLPVFPHFYQLSLGGPTRSPHKSTKAEPPLSQQPASAPPQLDTGLNN